MNLIFKMNQMLNQPLLVLLNIIIVSETNKLLHLSYYKKTKKL